MLLTWAYCVLHFDLHMMSASATAFATIKRFITFRLLENRIYENRLEYAYSARRFLPLISLNVFGGRINQPLKKTITHIAEWRPGGRGGQLSSVNALKCRMHEGSEGRRQQLNLSVFLCVMLSTIFACTLRKANFCEHCNC